MKYFGSLFFGGKAEECDKMFMVVEQFDFLFGKTATYLNRDKRPFC
jgi:hypothetical protein